MSRQPRWSSHRIWMFGLITVAVCALTTFQILPVSAAAKHPSRSPLGVEAHGQCTVSTPALTSMYVGSTNYLFVGWVGCDSGHSLNVEGSTDGVSWGTCGTYCTKHTISQSSWYDANSESGMTLVAWNGHLYVGWNDTSGHPNIGYYNWSSTVQNRHTFSTLTSHYTLAIATDATSSGYILYLVYTGTNSSLYFLHSSDGLSWSAQVKGNDTAAAGPAIAEWTRSPYGDHLYVAWRGTDANHRIYMGYFTGSATLSNHVGLSECVSTGCYIVATSGDVSLTDGQNGSLYVSFHSIDVSSADTGDAAVLAKTGDGYNFTYSETAGNYGTLGTTGVSGAFYNIPQYQYIWQALYTAGIWEIASAPR